LESGLRWFPDVPEGDSRDQRQHILDFSHGRPSGYTAEGPNALQKHSSLLRSDRGAELDDL